jgi:F-type H+-transporting ATPase subunit delta
MADFSTIARPYAKAVFKLAREQNAFKSWGDTLDAIAGLVANPQVAALITHPSLTRAQLAEVVAGALSGQASAEAVAFVRLLVDNGRLLAAPAIAEQFEALRSEAESRVDVQITSAVAVDTAQQQRLSAAIAQRLAREVAIEWKTDEALIAGAVIRAGDMVIDGSVQGELERLQTTLLR